MSQSTYTVREFRAAPESLDALQTRMAQWRRDPEARDRRIQNAQRVAAAEAARRRMAKPYMPQLFQVEIREASAEASQRG